MLLILLILLMLLKLPVFKLPMEMRLRKLPRSFLPLRALDSTLDWLETVDTLDVEGERESGGCALVESIEEMPALPGRCPCASCNGRISAIGGGVDNLRKKFMHSLMSQ